MAESTGTEKSYLSSTTAPQHFTQSADNQTATAAAALAGDGPNLSSAGADAIIVHDFAVGLNTPSATLAVGEGGNAGTVMNPSEDRA
jgi:hypothetical protein